MNNSKALVRVPEHHKDLSFNSQPAPITSFAAPWERHARTSKLFRTVTQSPLNMLKPTIVRWQTKGVTDWTVIRLPDQQMQSTLSWSWVCFQSLGMAGTLSFACFWWRWFTVVVLAGSQLHGIFLSEYGGESMQSQKGYEESRKKKSGRTQR